MSKTICLFPLNGDGYKIETSFSKKIHCSRCHCSFLTPSDNGIYTLSSEYKTNHYNIYIPAHCPNCELLSYIEFTHIKVPFLHPIIDEPGLPKTIDVDSCKPNIFPTEIPPVTIDENILSLSPRFVAIYQQALYAEQLGLNELWLFGYRKALEFLIKDYLVMQYPDKESAIEKFGLYDILAGKEKGEIKEISDFFESPEFKMIRPPADLVRIAGNNGAHYKEKEIPVEGEQVKLYLRRVATFIASRIDFPQDESPQFSQNIANTGDRKATPIVNQENFADNASDIENNE